MCEKGVNTDQMQMMVTQVDDSIAMAQQWLEKIHHMADHADLRSPSASVAQASVLLGEARAKLEAASSQIENDAADGGVTVELV